MSDDTAFLSHARYGKDKVRVLRVVREGKWHHIVEYNVQALLEGDIETSYTEADNSVVVATDSIKNITYYIAKISPHVLIPERFALHLGTHFVSKYPHIHKAFVTVEQLRWSRIPVPGEQGPTEHPHSFIRDGDEKRIVKVEVHRLAILGATITYLRQVDASKGKDKLVANVTAGLSDLLVLKTTESAFSGFVRDKYTTLKEVDDRILSTSIDLSYTFAPVDIPKPTDADVEQFTVPADIAPGSVWDPAVPTRARAVTLDTFVSDNSASVQATLYRMACLILAQNAGVQSVSYSLPNKHYLPVDMGYIGVENLVPAQAEVFMPVAAPSGLITATVSRK
ncbi:Uricase [Mycena sanguinolenta]|uniref:Uricase n=1 Tax=Mycena sanguinolenta TaxID=230812 RepID=A0A8H6ZAK0_9AGAR|nr:Uricase [Mycena sanguinolenta]